MIALFVSASFACTPSSTAPSTAVASADSPTSGTSAGPCWRAATSSSISRREAGPAHPNVYINTSAYKPSRYPAELVDYLRGGGRKKVLFGSNFPMLFPAQCLAEVDSLGLDAEARRLFLHDNAAKVFGL